MAESVGVDVRQAHPRVVRRCRGQDPARPQRAAAHRTAARPRARHARAFACRRRVDRRLRAHARREARRGRPPGRRRKRAPRAELRPGPRDPRQDRRHRCPAPRARVGEKVEPPVRPILEGRARLLADRSHAADSWSRSSSPRRAAARQPRPPCAAPSRRCFASSRSSSVSSSGGSMRRSARTRVGRAGRAAADRSPSVGPGVRARCSSIFTSSATSAAARSRLVGVRPSREPAGGSEAFAASAEAAPPSARADLAA